MFQAMMATQQDHAVPALLSGFPLESVEEKTGWLRDRCNATSQQATSQVTGSGPGGIPGV